VLPVLKSWEELAKEAGGDADFARRIDRLQLEGDESLGIGSAQRASMDGPVDASITYEEWFKGQSRERQLDIVGPGRLELWEEGNMPFRAMTNPDNSPVSLGKLREMYSFYVDKERFREWFEAPDKQKIADDFVVGNLPLFIQGLLNTTATDMRIGHDYFEIPSHKKRDIPSEKFASLLNKIKTTSEVFNRGDRNIGVILDDGQPWIAILKTTNDYSEVFLTSLRRIDFPKLERWRAQGLIIYKKRLP
jgi:hypothetical protein